MFDLREVSWLVALGRIALSLVIIVAAVIALDLIVYLQATSSTFNERVAIAFNDAYDYGYEQTFEIAYQEAHDDAFGRGYNKGYQLSLASDGNPVTRLIETRNPTYTEMMEFLEADDTDSKPFVNGEYVCFDYAAELNNNADAKGIRAAYVRIRSDEWGHALVAFDTVDKGLVYIEPQSDVVVELVIGEPYPWTKIGATSPLSYSDPILKIQHIW